MSTHHPRSDAFVFFGATGDLARKKIFPALYHLERRGRLAGPLIGVEISLPSNLSVAEGHRDRAAD